MGRRTKILLAAAGLLGILAWVAPRTPRIASALEWRLDMARGIVRGWIYPGDTLPVPQGVEAAEALPSPTPTPSPTPRPPSEPTPTPTSTPTPLPDRVELEAPRWEKQDWNNCGPATLALALRFYGWPGDQFDISALLKPNRRDKNVNVEELDWYVRNRAGWLGITYRVGGRLETLRAFLAEGFPVIVEKGYTIESGGGGWAGHYVLLTGYDEATQTFIVQDTNEGPDQRIGYEQLDRGWKAFNRVYILIYPPEAVEQVRRLLGPDQDPDLNRQRALEAAQREITSQPGDAYAWFNLGTNLVYFERYKEAAAAYDRALQLGLPWRFMRYQFGPYIAYFHTERFQDVIELAEATLRRTPEAEESLLWRGWARFRLGDLRAAREDFLAALEINPLYADARYALDYISAAP